MDRPGTGRAGTISGTEVPGSGAHGVGKRIEHLARKRVASRRRRIGGPREGGENGNATVGTGDAALPCGRIENTSEGGSQSQGLDGRYGARKRGRGPGISATVSGGTLLKARSAETGADPAAVPA